MTALAPYEGSASDRPGPNMTKCAIKILFVCSRNRIRSLSAEKLMKGIPGYQARSAGTKPSARILINKGHLGWADLIFVMEKRHLSLLRQKFSKALEGKEVVTLHIPDDFDFMQPELLEELRSKLSAHLVFPADRGLTETLRPLVQEIGRLRDEMRTMGLFDDTRELLECAACGLEEDVLAHGVLITTTSADRMSDTGLRFKQLSEGVWQCPKCGARVEEPPEESRPEPCR